VGRPPITGIGSPDRLVFMADQSRGLEATHTFVSPDFED